MPESTASVPSPRTRVRSLVRGGPGLGPPLFLPMVHALAARVEALDVSEFLTSPNKLANGLQALHQALGADGIVCCCAAGLEAEAAGAELDWGAYPPAIISHPAAGGQPPPGALERAAASPRVAAAVEATRRLAATAKGEPALVAALTGPLTLAAQLHGPTFEDALVAGDREASGLLEWAGQLDLAIAREFLQAGASVLMLLEEHAPPVGGAFESWRSSVVPIVNVARFHQALPALLPTRPEAGQADALLEQAPPGAVVCVPVEAQFPGEVTHPVGLALAPASVDWDVPRGSYCLLTTAGEVPFRQEIPDLRAACQRVQAALVSGSAA